MKHGKPPFKLLILIHSMNFGGAERVTANLANYWAERGWEITIVTVAPESLDSYDLHKSIKKIALNMSGDSHNVLHGLFQNIRRLSEIKKILHQLKPDIALAMMDTSNILLALAAWGITSLCTVGAVRVHPSQYAIGTVWEWLRQYTYGLLTAVTTQTKETEEWIKKNTRAKRTLVISNPVIWPLPKEEPHINPDHVIQPNRKILLAVGRLDSQKGFDRLLEVFSILAIHHPEWDLVILGEGGLRSILESQIHELGLNTRVFLPGRAGNIGDWYEKSDLLAMTSQYEGFPNVLIEAMAHGLPAVSFDCDTGPRDIIRQEVDGLLVTQGDLKNLADALNKLMQEPELRKEYANKAKDVRERFSMNKIAGMWESLFHELS